MAGLLRRIAAQGDRIPDLDANEAQEAREFAHPSFSPATQPPVSPREAFSELAAIKQELHAALLPEWEVMGPYSFGGPVSAANTATTFRLDSPFHTVCEFCVYLLSANVAAFVFLSAHGNQNVPAIATAPSYAQGDRVDGIAAYVSAAAPIHLPEIWHPLSADGSLYLTVQSAATTAPALAVVSFRRRRDKQAVYYE